MRQRHQCQHKDEQVFTLEVDRSGTVCTTIVAEQEERNEQKTKSNWVDQTVFVSWLNTETN